jgi:hypothetical protein
MFNASVKKSENSSGLRDKHLCAISEIIRYGGQFSVLASELAQLRLESGTRVSRAHEVVVGFGQRPRAVDRQTKEQSRAAMFAFRGEEQLQQLMRGPLDQINALLALPASILAEEEQRLQTLQTQSNRSDGWVSPISEEDREKILDAMMRRLCPTDSTLAVRYASSTEQNGIVPDGTLDEKHGAHRGDLPRDGDQHDQLSELVLPGVPARSTLGGIVHEFLILLQRALNLNPLLDELSELGARGDQKWKQVWLTLRKDIIREQKIQGATLNALAPLVKDLSLRKRVRMEACISATLDPQEMRERINRGICELCIDRALFFNMYIGVVVDAADEVGVDLGLPREDRKEEVVEHNGRQ